MNKPNPSQDSTFGPLLRSAKKIATSIRNAFSDKKADEARSSIADNLYELQIALRDHTRQERRSAPPPQKKGLLERPGGIHGIRWQIFTALDALDRGERLIVASRNCSFGIWLPGCAYPALIKDVLISEGLVRRDEEIQWHEGIEAWVLSPLGSELLARGRTWKAQAHWIEVLKVRLFE